MKKRIRDLIWIIAGLATLSLSHPAIADEKPEIFAQLGHMTTVDSAAMSADGKTIATGAFMGGIKIWDVSSGREIRTLKGHTSKIHSLAFSPDGRLVSSSSYDKTCRLWDVQSGKQLQKLDVGRIADKTGFTPDGKYFWARNRAHSIVIAETTTGRKSSTSEIAYPAFFSSSGKYALTRKRSSPAKEKLALWDVRQGRIIKTYDKWDFQWAAFSPDDRYVLSNKPNQTFGLWDLATGKELRSFEGPSAAQASEGFFSIRISKNGSYALATTKTTATLWDFFSGRKLGSFQLPKGFRLVDLSPDGRMVLLIKSSVGSSILRVANSKTGYGIKEFSTKQDHVISAAFSSDGKKLLLRGFGRLTLWDLKKNKESRKFEGHGPRISFVTFAPNGKKLALATLRGLVVWDTALAKVERIMKGHKGEITSAAFSKDGNCMISGSADKTVKLWDLATGMETKTFTGHTAGVISVAFSPDGRRVVSGSNDATVRVWNLKTGTEEKKLVGHKFGAAPSARSFTGVTSVEVSPDAKLAVSGGTDGKVIVWNLATGKQKGSLIGHTRAVTSVAFSPDGKLVASASLDGTVKLWELRAQKEPRTLSRKDSGRNTYVGFSRDGQWLLVRKSDDGSSWLWDVNTGKKIRSFVGDHTGLSSMKAMMPSAFSPDASQVLTADSMGGVARLWDTRTGKEIAQMCNFSDGEWVVITPEGIFNASQNGAKHLNVRVGRNVYGIEQFYEKFFNPAYVASVLQGKPVKAVADIRKGFAPPPEIKIISPKPDATFSTDTISIKISAKDQGGGIDEIRLHHNGKAIGEDRRGIKIVPKGNEVTKTYHVTLVDGANTFRAIGFSKDRTESNPSKLSVTLTAPQKEVSLYILAIGINKYKNPALNLNYAEPDAKGIIDFFRKRGKGLFKKVMFIGIYNEQATKESIISKLEQLKNTQPQDVVLVYLASHGENVNEKWYLIPHELTYPEREDDVTTKGLSSDELAGYIRGIKAQKVLILVDACKAGAALVAFRGFEDRKALSQLSRSTGVHIIAASTKDQFAAEVKNLGHGVFTYTLLEGLKGKASGGSTTITVRKLMGYVEEQLPDITMKYKQEAQYPVVDSRGMDFPLVIVK